MSRARSTDLCKQDITDSLLDFFFILFSAIKKKKYKEATSDSAEVIIKPDLMGHHMWRGALLGLRIYT